MMGLFGICKMLQAGFFYALLDASGLGLEMLQQIVATVGAQLVVRLQTDPVKRRGG